MWSETFHVWCYDFICENTFHVWKWCVSQNSYDERHNFIYDYKP